MFIDSYLHPQYTLDVNYRGTLNILEATRKCKSVKSVICVTTDKVYDHFKKKIIFKETDRLGGEDPYSLSKASAEFVIKSYRTILKQIKEMLSI